MASEPESPSFRTAPASLTFGSLLIGPGSRGCPPRLRTFSLPSTTRAAASANCSALPERSTRMPACAEIENSRHAAVRVSGIMRFVTPSSNLYQYYYGRPWPRGEPITTRESLHLRATELLLPVLLDDSLQTGNAAAQDLLAPRDLEDVNEQQPDADAVSVKQPVQVFHRQIPWSTISLVRRTRSSAARSSCATRRRKRTTHPHTSSMAHIPNIRVNNMSGASPEPFPPPITGDGCCVRKMRFDM